MEGSEERAQALNRASVDATLQRHRPQALPPFFFFAFLHVPNGSIVIIRFARCVTHVMCPSNTDFQKLFCLLYGFYLQVSIIC